MTRTKPAPHRVCGGIFTPDPDLPPAQNGQQVCRCGLVGQAGDAHHTEPEPTVDARGLAAGEKES